MVRIFAQLEDVGSEYYTYAPVRISATPFIGDCVYLDLEGIEIYNTVNFEGDKTSSWKPYNGIYPIGEYVKNVKTGEILGPVVGWTTSGKGTIVDLEDATEIKITKDLITGVLYQKYENGQPIGEPYFEEE